MKRPLSIALIIAFLSAGGAAVFYFRKRQTPAPPSPLRSPARLLVHTEGRVAGYPGSDITVGTEVGGVILQIPVEEGQSLRQGQLIAVLDSAKEEKELVEAQARIKEITADLDYQEGEARRANALHADGIISKQMLDQANVRARMARARLSAALAVQESLRVTKAKRRVFAPFEGIVLSRIVHPGETLLPGAPILRMFKKGPLRVEAQIDEFDLARIQIGMPVKVKAEGMETTWKGVVEEIPKFVEQRVLKPEDPARPADTRVLLAKVAFLEPTPLALGQRVELEIGGAVMAKPAASVAGVVPSTPLPPPTASGPSAAEALSSTGGKALAKARLEALMQRDVDSAQRLSLERLNALPPHHWTIRLLTARQPETLDNAARAFGDSLPDLFIVTTEDPRTRTPIHQLFLGHYPSREAATQAVKSLPSVFTDQDKPILFSLRKLRRAQAGRQGIP